MAVQYFSFDYVAEQLDTTPQHIARLCGPKVKDPIPSLLIGGKRRIKASDLEDWLARRPSESRGLHGKYNGRRRKSA